jgi:hypothetical protein
MLKKTREHNVSETGSVSVLRSGGGTPSQLRPLERANHNHSPPPRPKDGNRSRFRNVVFSVFLEYRTMAKVQKLGDSEQQKQVY